MATDIRRPITNELIVDFQGLTHADNVNTLFANVQMIYLGYPTETPVCEILPVGPSVEKEGIDYDTRMLGYRAVVYEELNKDMSYADTKVKLDRLMDIEDRILDYLQQKNHPLERAISGVHMYSVDVIPSTYSYEMGETGVRVYLAIDFTLNVNIDINLL